MGTAIPRITKVLGAALLALLLAPTEGSWAAEKRLLWDDELCSNSISFDPGKYDEVKLRNTLHLLFGPQDFRSPIASFPPSPEVIPKDFDVDRTTEGWRKGLEMANRIEFIPVVGIEDYRRATIAEIKDSCQFETVKIRGLRDPSALREYSPAVAACSGFIDAL